MTYLSPTATLTVEFSPGTEIAAAAGEAVRLARVLAIRVEFKFNDVTVCVDGDSSAELVAERFLAPRPPGLAGLRSKYIVGW